MPEPQQPTAAPPQERSQRRRFGIRKEPLLHFFVLGLVVFGMYHLLEDRPEPVDDPYLVEVSSGDLEWFRTMFRKRTGREPTLEELRGAVNQLIRERILSREATVLGLDKDDTVVRRRLAQRMEYLFQDISDLAEPSEDQLRAFLRDNRGKYEVPGRWSFTQIYFNSNERGADAAAEVARRLAEELNADEGSAKDTSGLGDRLLLPTNFFGRSRQQIRAEFGPGFAEAVSKQGPGAWQGPVASGYGVHAVLVHECSDAELPEFGELKEQLRADWNAAQQQELASGAYRELRARYRVLLEGMPYDIDQGS